MSNGVKDEKPGKLDTTKPTRCTIPPEQAKLRRGSESEQEESNMSQQENDVKSWKMDKTPTQIKIIPEKLKETNRSNVIHPLYVELESRPYKIVKNILIQNMKISPKTIVGMS